MSPHQDGQLPPMAAVRAVISAADAVRAVISAAEARSFVFEAPCPCGRMIEWYADARIGQTVPGPCRCESWSELSGLEKLRRVGGYYGS